MSRAARLRLLCLALCWVAAMHAAAANFTFAALGDAPYHADEEARFVELMAELNREPLAFAIHVGDFKSGSSACTEEIYRQRHDWFELSRHPFILVPGDNDWTDCWRALGAAHDPLERLAALRKRFFASPESLGHRRIGLDRQSDAGPRYPEHARWSHERVLFVTLNMPGGDNNRARMPEESADRTRAAVLWLRDAFRLARERKAPGLVVAMQANPWSRNGGFRSAYTTLMSELAVETLRYDGEVLLIHGDTHRYRYDQPLIRSEAGGVVPNFTRLEVYGSPVVDWVRVRISTDAGRIRFSVTRGSESAAHRQ